MISDLLWILLIAVAASLFWQQRRQSELARGLSSAAANRLMCSLFLLRGEAILSVGQKDL